MSDPHDIPGRTKTPRAEPLQPDKPGSGAGVQDDRSPAQDDMERAREQEEGSVDNVREGYGGDSTKDDKNDPSMVPNRPASDAQ